MQSSRFQKELLEMAQIPFVEISFLELLSGRFEGYERANIITLFSRLFESSLREYLPQQPDNFPESTSILEKISLYRGQFEALKVICKQENKNK